MATVSAMHVLSRLRGGERGEFESLRRKRQIPKGKRKKLMWVIALAIVVNPLRDRTLWVGPRTDAWIAMACNEFSEKQWYENFHLSKGTVLNIVNEVEDDVTRTDSKLRKAVPSFQRVALTIYFLASTAEYRSVANLFGVSRSFVSLRIKEVCQAIVERLNSRYITIPKGDDLKQVMTTSKEKWGFPVCAGAIGGTDVPIKAPSRNHTDYANESLITVLSCRL